MSSLVILLLAAVAGLFLLDKLPGVRLLGKPLVEGSFKLVTLFLGSFGLWLLYLVKSTFRAHHILVRHLFTVREKIAPEERVRHDGTLKP